MKLRVCPALRHCLLMTMVTTAVTVGTHGAYGGVMHSDVTMQTYTDFGQNKGYYAVGGKVNALLDKLRQDDGGITVSYTDGQSDRVVISNAQGMINFSGTPDNGASAVIGVNMMATVRHNGTQNPTFTERNLGSDYAIRYQGIDIKIPEEMQDVFRLSPEGKDYTLQRQSKIITDVTWNSVYSGIPDTDGDGSISPTEEFKAVSGLVGTTFYHAGAGVHAMYDEKNDQYTALRSAYQYITGSIGKIGVVLDVSNAGSDVQVNSIRTSANKDGDDFYAGLIGGADAEDPLPWGGRAGDSGSAMYVYNKASGKYEYLAACQSVYPDASTAAHSWTQSIGAVTWTQETMASFDRVVKMSNEVSTVCLNAITTPGEIKTDANGNTTTIYSGKVTDAEGNDIGVSYNGIQSLANNHTWADLSSEKDKINWYAYDNKLNQNIADLFFTSNLVFNSTATETNTIILNDTVDLGVGYAEFSGGSYIIKSEGTEGNLFNHAGYVINAGAEVHLKLTNPADYMFEWRKNGAGDLYIDGTGDTNALLNVGGTGTTYLNQTNGYAAYNVLANTGATVQITGGINQIKRDFTFGAGGGKLDMYGHSMTWNNSNDASAEGFTIHALTEEAIITNTKDTSTLTITDAGTEFLGSFKDSETGKLKVIYNGSGTLAMHSIHTNLSNSFDVESGKVSLSGTITEHAMGSESGKNTNRLVNENDWHYADAKMNVTVNNSGTFELGSHARLTGNVTVNENGTFVMHQGVNHRYEHMEGSANAKDTNEYAGYYGLKGNVTLNGANTTMKVQLGAKGEDVDSTTTYAYSISGDGSLIVDAATKEATLHLSGDNSGHTGTKTLAGGTLTAANMAALGDVSTNKWKVEAGATFVMGEGLDFSAIDHTATGGVIALTQKKQTTQLGVNSVIGAYEGYTVEYGTADQSLTATADKQWHLGGGGGTLVVNFLLTGANTLVLGDGTSTGVVKLTNTNNDFTGGIVLTDSVYLTYDDASVLGSGKIDLAYRSRLNNHGDLSGVTNTSRGSFYVDDAKTTFLDMSDTPLLSLAAGEDVTYSGTLTVATGADYRFGGGTGTLTVNTALSGEHDLIVDAHTHADNKVVLAQATSINGNVAVMGYDEEQSNGVTTGDMTLRLDASDALDFAASVTLKNNGHIDINGTTQSFAGISMDATSTIIDSSESFSGNLTLEGLTEGSSLGGEVSVGNLTLDVAEGNTFETDAKLTTNTLTKTGEGTLALSSGENHSYDNLRVLGGTATYTGGDLTLKTAVIDGGTLSVTGDKSLNAATTITGGGTLKLAHASLRGDLTVKASDEDVDGYVHTSTGGGIWFRNGVDVEKDAVLRITCDSASNAINFDASQTQSINKSGGTIEITNMWVGLANLADGGTQTFGGTIKVTNQSDVVFTAAESNHTTTRVFDTVEIANDKTLNLRVAAGSTTTWQFSNLLGGTLERSTGGGNTGTSKIKISPASGTEQSQVTTKITGDMSMEIAGNAKLSGENTYTGGTTVTGGTLTTANESALGTGGLELKNNGLALEGSNLTVKGAMTSEGGSVNMGGNTLNLTAADNSLTDTALSKGTVSVGSDASLTLSGTITMSGASFKVDGSVEVTSGTIFALSLSDFNAAKQLVLSTGSGSDSFAALIAANFTVNDIAASKYGLSVTQDEDDASIILTYTNTKDYTWSVGTGTWNKTDANWKRPENAVNEIYGNDGNVTFASNDSNTVVTVAEGASAVNMTVEGSYMFQEENFTVNNDLTVKENGKVTFWTSSPKVEGDFIIGANAAVLLEAVKNSEITGSIVAESSSTLSLHSSTTLTVTGGDNRLGAVEMGISTLSLGGASAIDSLKVSDGESTVNATAGVSIGELIVGNESSLNLDNATIAGMQLSGKNSTITNKSDTANLVMGDTISGIGSVSASTVEFVAGGETTLASGSSMAISANTITASGGQLVVDNGATLNITTGTYTSADGVVSVKNGGTLELNATTFIGSGGQLVVDNGATLNITTGTYTSADGTLSLESDSKLQLTATKFVGTGGKITLESGAVLDMTGTGLNDGKKGGVHDGNITNILNSVQGAGKLKLATTGDTTPAELTGSADVHTHVEVDGMLNLNAWKTDNGAVVTLHDDASLTTKGELRVQSTAVVDVNGGALDAQGGIKLGHSTAQNTGTLKLTDGTVTTTSIGAVTAHDNNKLIMNGGTLEFTQNDASAIGEGITTELNAGTLKAAASSWHVDRALELGDVTLDVASGKEIVFNGGLANTADTTLEVTGGGTLKVNGNAADINGVLNVTDTGKLVLNNASLNLSATYHKVNHIQVEGTSAINIKGSTTSNSVMHMNGLAVHALNSKDASLSNLTKFEDDGSTVYAAGASSENRSVISNAMIDIAEGATFNLSNAVVADTSRITDDSAFFRVNDVQVDVTNVVNAEITGTDILSNVTLQAMGNPEKTQQASGSVLAIQSTLMDTVTVRGSSLTIHLDKFSDIEKKSYDYVRLSFTDGTTPAKFATSLVVMVQYGGENLASPVYFAQSDAPTSTGMETVTTLYIDVQGLAVPEPTTTTLSLLALAALMARRRRK